MKCRQVRTSNRRRRHEQRAGTVLIFSMVAMTVLLAIGSLGVDYGRVQLAKTEMQTAVDAAARAASVYLPSDSTGARDAAISMAAAHNVDGTPLVLQTGDVEIGKWNDTTGVLDTASTSPDTVRITAHRTSARGNAISLSIGSMIGYPTQNLTVRQTTKYSSTGLNGIIGLTGITADLGLAAASYNSSMTTSPSTSNYRTYGILGSNGTIYGNWYSDLAGDAILGPSGSVSSRLDVWGSTTRRTTDIPTPTTMTWSPATNPGGVSQSYTVNSNTTLAGGTYYFTSLTLNANLSFSGNATLYINGNTYFADYARLTAYNSIPANLKVYIIGTRTFGDNSADFVRICADIEGPGTTFIFDDDLRFMGRMTVKTIDVDDYCEFYYDEAFGSANSSGGSVTTVR